KVELDLLRESGEPYKILDGDKLRALEPSLSIGVADGFSKATFCDQDACGDARLYALEAVRVAKERGVDFRWETRVRETILEGDRVVGVVTESGTLPCDACVIATGYSSRALMRPLGYDLQIHPVSGYSLTYDGVQGTRPLHGGVFISDKIAWAPFTTGRLRF